MVTWDDLDLVLALLTEIAPRWSAELNCAAPDDASIVILPEGASDLVGPSFVLHRDPGDVRGRVRLDQCRWDEYRAVGSFLSMDEAVAALRTRILPLVSRPGPANSDLK
jgi:hypothetical protein